jgi:hypothetical protein
MPEDPFVKVALGQKIFDDVIASLDNFGKGVTRDIKRLVKQHGEATKGLISFFAPVDTYFMQTHAETRYRPDGFSWESGYYADTFEAEGQRFYPPYQEFGTVNHGAQPSVAPAYENEGPAFQMAVTAVVRAAEERARKKK